MSDAKEAVLQKGFFFVQEASCTSLSAVLLKTLQGAWEGENRADRGLWRIFWAAELGWSQPVCPALVLIWISHWVQTASSSLLADLFGSERSILISPISAQSPWEVKEPGTQVSSMQWQQPDAVDSQSQGENQTVNERARSPGFSPVLGPKRWRKCQKSHWPSQHVRASFGGTPSASIPCLFWEGLGRGSQRTSCQEWEEWVILSVQGDMELIHPQ